MNARNAEKLTANEWLRIQDECMNGDILIQQRGIYSKKKQICNLYNQKLFITNKTSNAFFFPYSRK